MKFLGVIALLLKINIGVLVTTSIWMGNIIRSVVTPEPDCSGVDVFIADHLGGSVTTSKWRWHISGSSVISEPECSGDVSKGSQSDGMPTRAGSKACERTSAVRNSWQRDWC